ncbi:hypothetical protein [Bacteroides oleiciplenus]|uniref:hypothetical protein n=1 Tax=Bacteroides oleiciplenus TaxID=626931 RepID=UPI0026DD653D|nr:hypothetical protein [Bacteroides oleiciplenus]
MRLFSESEAGLRSYYFANALPKLWQSLAKAMAKVCHSLGRRLAKYWQKIYKSFFKEIKYAFSI